mgnify:CR=1 FL=1
MTEDQPSEAALRKAYEVLNCNYPLNKQDMSVIRLARHFDAEDKAAREAFARCIPGGSSAPFIRRHILPDPKPTLRSILLDESLNVEAKERAIRDAGLLREDG